MADPFFFGYGSLVNRATQTYPDATLATLDGWRRIWRYTSARDVAYLSVFPSASTQIEGLIAHVPGADWVALDEREAAYARHRVTPSVRHGVARPVDIQVYAVPVEPEQTIQGDRHIILSYLDVVVQGYLREFGEAGVQRFFETTDGWDSVILDDRAAPQYPRHQRLRADETMLVDDWITQLGCQKRQAV